MVLDDLIVARVRFEPERKGVANDRHDSDELVNQDIERHAREQDLRNPEARSLNKREGGDQGRAGIAETRQQPDQGIEAESEFRSRDADELVHDQGEPFEKRLQPLAPPLFFRRKNFPIDFLQRRSRRSAELGEVG